MTLGILLIGSIFLQLMIYVILVSLAFNTVVFVYLVYLKKDFPLVEFILIYGLNFITFIAILFSAIKEYVTVTDYPTSIFLRGLIFALLSKVSYT